ncbi:cAMP-binding proteins - catabolite gene activator and regulatory subunit of cAMP-dependent protein kinases [hydrothermal vent metagenome]|uniref:cAMP-binding proteins - catabolite gene activator and regulatory subunit of cAMP-dependent protein kinases n=1 Tax=hydrothermal vent metagenome TaxID=652676 RepID=A0A3B1E502_9ZZZZ
MYTKYKEFITKYIPLNFIEWNIIKSKLKIVLYKKDDIIHNIGDICTQLMFINSGLARAYILDENGKDSTWAIYFNDKNSRMVNLFVVDYASFINQTKSKLAIDAIEDCEVVMINFKDVEFLYNNTKKGDRFGRLINQEVYTYLHNFIIQRQTKSAKDRFEEFVNTTPHLLKKVPQYHIATFLGITPQHLSRLKKESSITI